MLNQSLINFHGIYGETNKYEVTNYITDLDKVCCPSHCSP